MEKINFKTKKFLILVEKLKEFIKENCNLESGDFYEDLKEMEILIPKSSKVTSYTNDKYIVLGVETTEDKKLIILVVDLDLETVNIVDNKINNDLVIKTIVSQNLKLQINEFGSTEGFYLSYEEKEFKFTTKETFRYHTRCECFPKF